MYAPIDLQTSLVAQGMGVLLVIIGLAVVAHGLWRRKRYRTHLDDQDARYAGPDRIKDSTREIVAGAGVLVLGLASLAFATFESNASDQAVQDNVAAKYGVESVVGKEWIGNALKADVTMPDGSVHHDVLITFESSGEPQIARDLSEAPSP